MRAIRTTFGGSFCGSLVTVRKALVREMHDSWARTGAAPIYRAGM